MKKIINKLFAVLITSTVFAHAMLHLNKNQDIEYNRDFYRDMPTGNYHYFDSTPLWAINIIYCLYFVYAILIILRVVDIREGFGLKNNKNT
jgi:hypothetical protein